VLLLSWGGDLERGAYRGQFIGEDVDAAVVLATDDPNDLSGPEVAARTFVIAGPVGERGRRVGRLGAERAGAELVQQGE
jgi:hypothetical protein